MSWAVFAVTACVLGVIALAWLVAVAYLAWSLLADIGDSIRGRR